MFKIPDTRLSASNSAVLASESFFVPVTLRSEAKGSEAALDGLHRSFEEVKGCSCFGRHCPRGDPRLL
jgi:hypothetical protein